MPGPHRGAQAVGGRSSRRKADPRAREASFQEKLGIRTDVSGLNYESTRQAKPNIFGSKWTRGLRLCHLGPYSAAAAPTPTVRQTETKQGLPRGPNAKGVRAGVGVGIENKHKLRFQSSVFFKIKITHCLETIYTRVTKNSCPGISIHRFVNYTHMVTSVLAKKFIGNIHKALEMYTV